MQRFKRIVNKIVFLHPVLAAVLIAVATVLLIYAFIGENVHPAAAIGSYVLSFYALIVLCAAVPGMIRFGLNVRENNRYVHRYVTDLEYRTKTSLYASLMINALYAAMQLYMGYANHTVWFYALSGYYALLAIMRFFLLRDALLLGFHRDRLTQLKHYRFCGAILLLLNQAISVIVAYIVWQNRGFSYHEIATIAMAAYSFMSITLAIMNAVKYRRRENPTLSAAKMISLASAMVSILSLETAMISAFDTAHDELFRRVMTTSTGGGICALVLAMAVYMIVTSTKEIRAIKKERQEHES